MPQPTPRQFAVVPSGDDIGARAKDQMKVIRKDRKSKQVDPKSGGELLQVFFDPNLSVIKILARDRVIAHQKASSDGPIIDMSDRNLIGVKDFGPR